MTMNSFADKNDRTNYAVIKSESFARDLQAQAAKVLETGQVVKIAIENQADSPDGETYEPICESSSPQALPPANNSFLWSNHRAKSFPSDKHDIRNVSRENADGDAENSEEYDDVGPSNFVAQAVRITITDSVIVNFGAKWYFRAEQCKYVFINLVISIIVIFNINIAIFLIS